MKQKFTIEGSYTINGKEEKHFEEAFEIEYDVNPETEERNNKLLKLLNHPWRLIKEGGKLGVNGVKRFSTVLFLFGGANTILFIYSLSRLFASEFEFSKLLMVLLVLIVGLGITLFSAYRTYQYVLIDTLRVIYENLSSFFQKVSESVIDKVEDKFKGKVDLTDNQLTKAMDFGKMVNTKYRRTPKFLRRSIVMVLNKIPFVGMLLDVKDDIAQGNKVQASAKLYNKMDGFISNTIFGSNNTRWVWWLLPLNIIGMVIFIRMKIG